MLGHSVLVSVSFRGAFRSLLLAVFLLSLPVLAMATPFSGGGSGTAADPYQIATADQFDEIRNHKAAHFVLLNDIDLAAASSASGSGWAPIGSFADPFTGHLDGKGFAIRNLIIARDNLEEVGLFGASSGAASITHLQLLDATVVVSDENSDPYRAGLLLGSSATFAGQDITITDVLVSGSLVAEGAGRVGCLAGSIGSAAVVERAVSHCNVTSAGVSAAGGLVGSSRGEIRRSQATGFILGGDRQIGGLVGVMNGGRVVESFATGSINASPARGVGGLAGEMDGAEILRSFATGMVIGGSRVGGLVGETDDKNDRIEDAFATGMVVGETRVGGLVGYLDDEGTIKNAFATGTVISNGSFGGLVATVDDDFTVSASFWDVETSGIGSAGDDNFGAIGKTTAELKQFSTFEAAGWPIVEGWAASNPSANAVWGIRPENNDGYPFFLWQVEPPPAPFVPIPVPIGSLWLWLLLGTAMGLIGFVTFLSSGVATVGIGQVLRAPRVAPSSAFRPHFSGTDCATKRRGDAARG